MFSEYLAALTPDALAPPFDRQTVARGDAYARQGMVVSSRVVKPPILVGTCRGSRPEPYMVIVTFREVGTRWHVDNAECSCPVEGFCKHAVAVVLAYEPPTAVVPAGWESELGGLLEPSGHRGDPIAIAVSLRRDRRHAQLSATIRPMTIGRSGRWIKSGLTWSDLCYPDHGRRFEPRLFGAMAGLAMALRRDGYGTPTDDFKLSLVSSSFWNHLAGAVDAGVPLIPGPDTERGIHLAGIVLGEPRHVALRVESGTTAGSLIVSAAVAGAPAADAPTSPQPILVGHPPHGVLELDSGVLTMAPLDPPPTGRVLTMLTAERRVEVPPADVDRFTETMLPQLSAIAPIEIVGDALAEPEVEGPVAVLRVIRHAEGVLLSWAVRYVVDGKQIDEDPLAEPNPWSPRDPTAEAQLWQRLARPVSLVALAAAGTRQRMLAEVRAYIATAGMSDWVPQVVEELRAAEDDVAAVGVTPVYLLLTDVPLTDLETAEFYLEAYHELVETPELIVEEPDELPDYRRHEGPPEITFGVVPSVQTDWLSLSVTVRFDDEVLALAEILRLLTRGHSQVVLPSGLVISLDHPALHRLAELVDEARALEDLRGDRVPARSMNASLWEELFDLGVVDEQADAWAGRMRALAQARPPQPVEPPEGLAATLRDYQRDGLTWLSFLVDNGIGGVLADDMGLGKTLQTLALILRSRIAAPDAPPFLVIAPTSVVGNWAAESARFAPGLRVVVLGQTSKKAGAPVADRVDGADVVVTSYTLLRLGQQEIAELDWSGLILDEAQFVKNRNAKAHQAARLVRAPFKLAITGTPMENNLGELWSLLSIVAPGLYPNPKSFDEYFRKPIESGTEPELLATLRRRIRPILLRRTKDQVAADLPAKQEQVVALPLHGRHRKIYDTRLTRERQKVLALLDEDPEENRFQVFSALTRLRRLAIHAGLVDDDDADVTSAKVEYLVQTLPELIAEGHSALVFSQFTGFLAIIRAALAEAGVMVSYLDGSLSTTQRKAAITEFTSGETRVFLISLKAGGFGLNLTEADYCFVADPWWNPAAEAQAVDRAHRIGQTRPVTVYRLVSADTIEEKVIELQERKRSLFNAAIDDGELFSGAIGEAEIRALLGG